MPRAMDRSIASTAVTSPKRFVTPMISTSGAVCGETVEVRVGGGAVCGAGDAVNEGPLGRMSMACCALSL